MIKKSFEIFFVINLSSLSGHESHPCMFIEAVVPKLTNRMIW